MIPTSLSKNRLPLVSMTMLSSSSISWEVDTGGAVAKQLQVVRLTIPVVEDKRPANTTPCLVKMTLAHWCRLTRVGGDVVIVFREIFSNFLSIDKDFFQVLLNKRAGNSCAVPQGQKEVFLIIASQPPQLKRVFLTYLLLLLTKLLRASARSWGGSTPPSEQVAESQLVRAPVGPWVPSSEQVTAWEMIPRRISEQSCSIWELVKDSRGSL